MRRLRLLAVAATVLLAAAVTACGGDGGGSTTATGATQRAPTVTQAQTQPRTSTSGGAAVPAATLATGRQAFLSNGCSGCHTLAAAGATGSVGPNLDDVLPGKSAAFVRQSIVDPNATIASGFSAGTMPQDFQETIPPADLTALVAFLHQQAGR